MVADSSRSRESTTRVSRSPHWGQRIALLSLRTTTTCGVRRGYHYMVWSEPRLMQRRRLFRRRRREVRLELCGAARQAGDRLARMDEVQVPALDRGVGLQLPSAPDRFGEDRRAMVDHRERAVRALQLGHELVADRFCGRGTAQRPSLLGVAGDGVGRGLDGRADGARGQLLATNRIDASGGAVERLVDA